MKSILAILLFVSLCVNAYLLMLVKQHVVSLNSQQAPPATLEKPQNSNEAKIRNQPNTQTSATSDTDNENTPTFRDNSVDTTIAPEELSIEYLKALKAENKFEALRFHVSRYLRQHPQDIDALLLEADAFYYTEPLNTALINYYGLRDALISDEQLDNINQIINVNTTRIIQQFSGDGSWDLLASFLEPLIQVDPLNRRYLLALAKAYGMQDQSTLMEDVLAALPLNDPRAQRLRDSIYGDDTTSSPQIARQEEPAPSFEGETKNEVLLVERRGQYYTNVSLSKVEAQLLVDTGASITAVSDAVFEKINSRNTAYLGNFTVQTAGGRVSSQMYKVSELTLGSTTVRNVSVMVLPSENMSDFDGLLGMNVIRMFDISYDQSLGRMRMFGK